MKPHHEHINKAAVARYSIELSLNAFIPQKNGQINQSLGIIAALAIAGLTLSPSVIAVSLPQSIKSEIFIDEIVETTPNFFDLNNITQSFRQFDINNSPHVVQSGSINQFSTSNYGYGYADAQNQWGNKAYQSFNSPGGNGIGTTSFYGATFIKENDTDVLHTRISNTKLSILDLGSGGNTGNSFANFNFRIFAESGRGLVNGFGADDSALLFDKTVAIKGETGFHGGNTFQSQCRAL